MSYYCKRCRAWVVDGEVPHKNFILSVAKSFIKSLIERGETVTETQLLLLEKDDMCYNEPTEQRTKGELI